MSDARWAILGQAPRVVPDGRPLTDPERSALGRLRCHRCGRRADTVHLLDAETLGYPRGREGAPEEITVLFACPAHDFAGYWKYTHCLADEWDDWRRHLAGKVWRGDHALARLLPLLGLLGQYEGAA